MEYSMCMKHKMVSEAIWNDGKNIKQRKIMPMYERMERNMHAR